MRLALLGGLALTVGLPLACARVDNPAFGEDSDGNTDSDGVTASGSSGASSSNGGSSSGGGSSGSSSGVTGDDTTGTATDGPGGTDTETGTPTPTTPAIPHCDAGSTSLYLPLVEDTFVQNGPEEGERCLIDVWNGATEQVIAPCGEINMGTRPRHWVATGAASSLYLVRFSMAPISDPSVEVLAADLTVTADGALDGTPFLDVFVVEDGSWAAGDKLAAVASEGESSFLWTARPSLWPADSLLGALTWLTGAPAPPPPGGTSNTAIEPGIIEAWRDAGVRNGGFAVSLEGGGPGLMYLAASESGADKTTLKVNVCRN